MCYKNKTDPIPKQSINEVGFVGKSVGSKFRLLYAAIEKDAWHMVLDKSLGSKHEQTFS